MDLSPVRNVAIAAMKQVIGDPMCGTLADGTRVERVIWMGPQVDDVAGRNRQLDRVFRIATDDPANVERGSFFVGPGPNGGEDKTWRVDNRRAVKIGMVEVLVTEVKS